MYPWSRYRFVPILLVITALSFVAMAGNPVFSLSGIPLSGLRARDPIPEGDFNTLTIPIKRANNLILIEAVIDSVRGNFILDFGAPYLVLNNTYFRNTHKDYSQVTAGVTGTNAFVMRTNVGRLKLGALHFENIDADVTNLGRIEDKRGVKILGLLGVNLFLHFDVEIDLQNNVLYLHRLDGNGNPVEGATPVIKNPQLQMPVLIYHNTILMDGEIAGRKLRFCLDSGAELNVINNKVPGKVIEALKIDKRLQLHGTGGGRMEVLSGTLTELRLNGQPFKNMRTIIANLDQLGKAYGYQIDGMLGYEFLSRGIVNINFVQKTLKMSYFDKP